MERWVVIVHSTGNENLDPTTLKIKIEKTKTTKLMQSYYTPPLGPTGWLECTL